MKAAYWALVVAATLPTIANANQAGDIILRVGSATVRPSEGSGDVLGLGSFNVNNNTELGLTLGYMFTDNIGMELLGATPFHHNIGLRSLGTIAEVRQLPPSLMAQYYFGDKQDKFRPYVGLGVNYTVFYDTKFNDVGKSAGLSDLSASHSWGVATQAGLDYNLADNWLLNMSVWWMDIDTNVKFKAGEDHHNIHTRINPWVFMFGVGYRF